VLQPRRELTVPAWARWLNNAGLWLTGLVVKYWLLAGLTFSVPFYIEKHQIGLMHNLDLSAPAKMVCSVLLLDLLATLKHRLFHILPALWRLHSVHHSDVDCDFSTALRSHPLDSLVDGLMTLFILMLVGAPPEAALVFFLIVLSVNPLRHANVRIAPAAERVLRLFVVTPDFHRVHHSSVVAETNSNFGGIFPWWDWIMNTYRPVPSGGQGEFRIGLEYFRNRNELWLPRLLTQPFRQRRASTLPGVRHDPAMVRLTISTMR